MECEGCKKSDRIFCKTMLFINLVWMLISAYIFFLGTQWK